MTRQAKTANLIDAAAEILAALHPMTLRQLHYQLVSRQVTENSRSAYQALSKAMVAARQEGIIPWEWMEDRLRQPRHVSMWQNLAHFGETVLTAYRRDVWGAQYRLAEVWLEKDALSGVFEEVLNTYGVTLNVGRGFDGWDSIHNAAVRYGDGSNVTVLYFGDFDPSGEDMVRSLGDRLSALGCEPEIIKAALNREDIDQYRLPPNLTKPTDTRRAAFVAEHGDISVELDALPPDVLRQRLVTEVEARMDLAALQKVRRAEDHDRLALKSALARLSS